MYLYYLLGFKAFHYKSKEEVLRDRKGKEDEDLAPKTFKNVLPDKEKTEVKNLHLNFHFLLMRQINELLD